MMCYVESNFVLEIALGQEQASAAEAILSLAERSEINLALPAFSLSESHRAIQRRANNTQRLGNELRHQLNALGRSRPHQADVEEMRAVTAHLENVEGREFERLTATTRRLVSAAQIIPSDASTYRESLNIMDQFGLSHQDAVVYTSVRQHIASNHDRGPHVFVNRDKHFDVLWIRTALAALNCELVTDFEEFALRLGPA